MVIWPRPPDVGRAGFQAHHVRLLQLELGGVLMSDDALSGLLGVERQAVEQRRLARAGAAGDDDVAAALADDLEDLRAFRRDRAEVHQLIESTCPS